MGESEKEPPRDELISPILTDDDDDDDGDDDDDESDAEESADEDLNLNYRLAESLFSAELRETVVTEQSAGYNPSIENHQSTGNNPSIENHQSTGNNRQTAGMSQLENDSCQMSPSPDDTQKCSCSNVNGVGKERKDDSNDRWCEFISWLHRPSDPASIAVFRILFGLFMIHDIMNERHMPYLSRAWSEPVHCHFPLFDFIAPLPLAWLYVIHLVMLIGAICIALGIVLGFTSWLYIIPYWYMFLLDKTRWNNHSYLYGLIAFLISFTDASHSYSFDALLFSHKNNAHVPFWNYAILRFQIVLVYFFAGLKKIDMDWLTGWSMQNLSKHWVFAPFSLVMEREFIDVVIVHLGGFMMDLFGGWLLLFSKTRPFAILFLSKFHLMNATMFEIGMFPYVMLVTSAIFCHPSWPRDVFSRLSQLLTRKSYSSKIIKDTNQSSEGAVACNFGSNLDSSTKTQIKPEDDTQTSPIDSNMANMCLFPEVCRPSRSCMYDTCKTKHASSCALRVRPFRMQRLTVIALAIYVGFQCFLPWSHFITKGYNLWTNGLYGYSWDMMVQTWSLQHLKVAYVTAATPESPSETGYLNPEAMTVGMGRRWSSHPDMIKQYGRCVQKTLNQLGMNDFELYVDVWRSMNGRFQQRMIDPKVDILRAEWSPFSAPDWTLPLLDSLTDWRGRLKEIKAEFRRQSEESNQKPPNVIFAADFPGMHLENYIHRDQDQVFVELLSGEIEIEFLGPDAEDIEARVDEGQRKPVKANLTVSESNERVRVPSGEYHKVHTKGSRPSCYMYIYINSTDSEVWRNITIQRELVQLMENATFSSVGDAKWNFSDIDHIAQFTNKTKDDPDLHELRDRFLRRSADLASSSRPLLLRLLDAALAKIVDQAMLYGKALENAGKAIISILDGISMEDYLRDERLRRESVKIGAANGDD